MEYALELFGLLLLLNFYFQCLLQLPGHSTSFFFSNYTTEKRVTSCGFNKWMHFFPHFDALRMISSGIGHMVLSLFRQSLYSRVRENSYKHVSSPYSCNSVISAPGNIFQHQLVKQFQISNANSSLFIQFHTPPSLQSPPSILPSLPLSFL